jgi:hypothetical protein
VIPHYTEDEFGTKLTRLRLRPTSGTGDYGTLAV